MRFYDWWKEIIINECTHGFVWCSKLDIFVSCLVFILIAELWAFLVWKGRGNIEDSVSDMKLRIAIDARASALNVDATTTTTTTLPIQTKWNREKKYRVNSKSDSIVRTAKFNEYRLQSLSASNEVMLQRRYFDLYSVYPVREFSEHFGCWLLHTLIHELESLDF